MKTFHDFKVAISAQFNAMIEMSPLFVSSTSKEDLFDTYLASFPEGTDPVFRERTTHNCNCCKSFIRKAGKALAINGTELVSIWDIDIGGHYQVVADAMAKMVKEDGIYSLFKFDEKHMGTNTTLEVKSDIIWEHFHHETPKDVYSKSVGTEIGKSVKNFQTLKRSITEITSEAIELVLDLIDQNSLYRGEEHKKTVQTLKTFQREYEEANNADTYIWLKTTELGNYCNIRGSVIGTLLDDLSQGKDLEAAVKSFESKVAPSNYKRSNSLITQAMIVNAMDKFTELGLENAEYRRHAQCSDLSVNDLLYVDRSVKSVITNSFEGLIDSIPDKLPNLDKVVEISIDDFIEKVVPKAESIEMMFSNKHESNLMSLTAPVMPNAAPIMKWDNNFAWSYKNDVADSMKEQVRNAGGNVEGDFRFTNSWNHNNDNNSLMDLHVFFPTNVINGSKHGKTDDTYGNTHRVGWNNRKHLATGGAQDVDYTSVAPTGYIPIENISFEDKNKMPSGTYYLMVHNWQKRSKNTGFKAEIELEGEIHNYEYTKPMKNKEWVAVAEVTLKDGKFTIKHMLDSTTSSKKVWGISTEKYHKVQTILKSPNYWEGNSVGNRHTFFILEDCENPDSVRGFYNEFLRNELTPHRKVFEILGSKMKAEYSPDQLSGLGFSSTVRNSVLVRVKGSFNRILKINF